MPKTIERRDVEQSETADEALRSLTVDVIANIIEEDKENEEKVRDALREVVEEKMGDIDEEIKNELGERVEELDMEEVREEAIKEGVSRVLQKLSAKG